MGGIAEGQQRKDRRGACRDDAGRSLGHGPEKRRTERANSVRPCGWVAARRERMGMATVLSWRSRTGKGDGFSNGEGNAVRGSHGRSEEHMSELQSHHDLVCRLLLE